MANLGCLTAGQAVIVLSPEHARVIAGTGWSKADVQGYLFEQAKRAKADVQRVGKFIESGHGAPPDDVPINIAENVHRGRGPDDILITVAGGDAGAHSAFIPSWSQGRGSIMQSKPIGVCLDCG